MRWEISIDGMEDCIIVPQDQLIHIRFGKKLEKSRVILRIFSSSKSGNRLVLLDGCYTITADGMIIEGWMHDDSSIGGVITMLESFNLDFCDKENPIPQLMFCLTDTLEEQQPIPVFSLGGLSAVSFNKVENPDTNPFLVLSGLERTKDDFGRRVPIYSENQLVL